VPTCEGNSRRYAKCAPVDSPYAVRGPALLGYTADRSIPIELARQFETASYVGSKFRLGVGNPCAEATVDLRPLNHAEGLGPVREVFVISSQVAQRGFPHPLAEQIAHTANRF